MSARCGTKNCWPTAYPCSRVLAVLLLSLALGACKSSSHLAPIEQLDQPPGIKLTYHTVSRSDTLYSIAWRYGADYHELASINNIAPPYTIRVGQKINLASAPANSAGSVISASSPGVEVRAIADDANAVTEVTAVSEVSKGRPSKEAPVSSPESVKPSVERSVEQQAVSVSSGNSRWQWPTNGRIVSRYSATDPMRKGIDLDGKLGEPVAAAQSGSVVYAGSGLAGYGELIIIKHDEQFLSAYGHNSKLLVKEGDKVRAGQKIAEVGSSGTDGNKLHFEIRRDGKPVDPLQYLPKK